jgi:hypothetical protein
MTMEFEAAVSGTNYTFSFINDTSVLISGENAEYILYKIKQWHCADEISESLLEDLSAAIDNFLRMKTA